MVKFFVPHADNEKMAEEIIYAIKKFVGWSINNKRFYYIHHTHDGKEYSVKVGEIHREIGEEVIAILESDVVFLICTTHRGVLGGEPYLVGKNNVLSIEEFE